MSVCSKQDLVLDNIVFSGGKSGRQHLLLTILMTIGFVPQQGYNLCTERFSATYRLSVRN